MTNLRKRQLPAVRRVKAKIVQRVAAAVPALPQRVAVLRPTEAAAVAALPQRVAALPQRVAVLRPTEVAAAAVLRLTAAGAVVALLPATLEPELPTFLASRCPPLSGFPAPAFPASSPAVASKFLSLSHSHVPLLYCGGYCVSYWRTHPQSIWAICGYWNTIGRMLGLSPPSSPNLSLLDALRNTRTDGLGDLYREGTAAFLNSLANQKFIFSSSQVRNAFASALVSDQAAAEQAQIFKRANEGRL